MKTLKIFVAAADELKAERMELADMVGNLNYVLNKMDMNIVMVKYNPVTAREIQECEICMVLYWTKFGLYSKSELDTAYSSLKEGQNPRKLYVYFKDSEQELTPELKAFRDSFPTEYGHFHCVFRNEDALKAHFLLQFIDYQNALLKNSPLIEVKDAKVIVGGKQFADLNNVDFLGKNEEYTQLAESIDSTRIALSVLDVSNPKYSKLAQRLQDQLKKLHELEQSLWNTALTIIRLSNEVCSERLRRAIELFESGDNRGANAILNEEEILKDAERNLSLIDAGKEGLKTNVAELTLKINTLNSTYGIGTVSQVLDLYDHIIDFTEKLYGEKSLEHADALEEAAYEWRVRKKFDRALYLNEKALIIRRDLLGNDHPDVATSYAHIASIYWWQDKNDLALQYNEKALEIRLNVLSENHHDVATSYNNMGLVYMELYDYPRALEYYEKSLQIDLKVLGAHHSSIAITYRNIGALYYKKEDITKALNYYIKALDIELLQSDKDYDQIRKNKEKIRKLFLLLRPSHMRSPYEVNTAGIAIMCKKQDLQINRLLKGEDLSESAEILHKLGNLYQFDKDYEHALNSYEESLGIRLSLFGENHKDVVALYIDLGSLFCDMDDCSKSLEYLTKARSIIDSLLDDLDKILPLLAMCFENMGRVHFKQGKYPVAQKYFEETLKIRREIYGEYHPDIAKILEFLGYAELTQQNYSQAIEYYQQFLKLQKLMYIELSKKMAPTCFTIAHLYFTLGQYPQALKYCEELLQIDLANFGEGDEYVIKDRQNIQLIQERMAKN